MTAPSPTQLSLKHLRSLGYVAEVVEWRDRYGRTHDLVGFVDILAFGDGETVAVQTTSSPNMAARITKINESPFLPAVLAAGWRVVVHGWRDDGRLREHEL